MCTLIIGSHGDNIVALHGIQATNKSWIGISEQLKQDFKVILPNLIGRKINETNVANKEYSLDEYAKDLNIQLKKTRHENLAYWLEYGSVCYFTVYIDLWGK